MFLEQAMCDVVITFKNKNQQIADKPTIGAHRVVLSAMSPLFREKILTSPAGSGHTLELDHDPRVIQKLLNYIYTGNLMDDCAEVTRCASELEIFGIDQLCKFETEVHQPIRSSGGRVYNPTLTLKSEMSDDEELDLFEDSDEWDPILAPELILHVGNEPPSSLAGSSSGEDDCCDPMKFDISMPDDLIDDAADRKVDAVPPEGRPSEKTKRGRPKGSCATAKRIKVLSPGLALPPQVINKIGGGSGNNKKYLCSLCGRTLTGLTAYNRHQVVHTGARPFECDTCEKTFTQAQRLKIHVRKHTGERPYLCSLCGKTFTESCKLKRHLASVHKANRDGNELIPGQPVVNAKIPYAATAGSVGKMVKEPSTAVGGKKKQTKASGKAKVNTSHPKVK